MTDDLKNLIDQELGECLTPEELCQKYAEVYSFLKEQMKACMEVLTKETEDE